MPACLLIIALMITPQVDRKKSVRQLLKSASVQQLPVAPTDTIAVVAPSESVASDASITVPHAVDTSTGTTLHASAPRALEATENCVPLAGIGKKTARVRIVSPTVTASAAAVTAAPPSRRLSKAARPAPVYIAQPPGVTGNDIALVPQLVPCFKGKTVLSVSAGEAHSAVVVTVSAKSDIDEGASEVFVWGCNQFGQLGLADTLDRSLPSKLKVSSMSWPMRLKPQ